MVDEKEGVQGAEGEGEEDEVTFEGMLETVLSLYKALLQAIAALGFPCVLCGVQHVGAYRVCVCVHIDTHTSTPPRKKKLYTHTSICAFHT